MKLKELFDFVSDPMYDVVSVYDTTEGDFYHTLFEGVAKNCPQDLLERNVISLYPAFVLEECGICICLDGTEE